MAAKRILMRNADLGAPAGCFESVPKAVKHLAAIRQTNLIQVAAKIAAESLGAARVCSRL
jgi:hypothetical protein